MTKHEMKFVAQVMYSLANMAVVGLFLSLMAVGIFCGVQGLDVSKHMTVPAVFLGMAVLQAAGAITLDARSE